MASAARDIGAGKLGARSGVSGDDEPGALGQAFDSMADELGGAPGSARLDSARSRSILDALVHSNPDGVIEIHAGTGIVRSFNPAARSMLGEEFDLRGPDGESVRVEMRAMIVEGGAERITVLGARDLSNGNGS